MVHRISYLSLFSLSLILSGCQPTPWVIDDYDDLTKSKVCKLNNYMIRNEFGMTSSRQTFLTLEKRADKNIKAILTSGSNIGLTHYDSFSSDAKIKFKLSGPNQQNKEVVFQSEVPRTQYGTQPIYAANGIVLPMPTKSSSLVFYLTEEQLTEIISAPEVAYTAEAGDNPLTGKINEPIKKLIKSFIDKCCKGIQG